VERSSTVADLNLGFLEEGPGGKSGKSAWRGQKRGEKEGFPKKPFAMI
jgi:hypothetical protein